LYSMDEVYWNSDSLVRHPGVKSDPLFQEIQMFDESCFTFLEWLLSSFDQLKVHFMGLPYKVNKLEGVDSRKLELIGDILHKAGTLDTLFALGVEIIGKGTKREVRVTGAYAGLSSTLCFIIAKHVQNDISKGKKLSLGSMDQSSVAFVHPVVAPIVADHRSTSTPQTAQSSPQITTTTAASTELTSRTIGTSCTIACSGCTRLRKKKKLLQQHICRLRKQLKKQQLG